VTPRESKETSLQPSCAPLAGAAASPPPRARPAPRAPRRAPHARPCGAQRPALTFRSARLNGRARARHAGGGLARAAAPQLGRLCRWGGCGGPVGRSGAGARRPRHPPWAAPGRPPPTPCPTAHPRPAGDLAAVRRLLREGEDANEQAGLINQAHQRVEGVTALYLVRQGGGVGKGGRGKGASLNRRPVPRARPEAHCGKPNPSSPPLRLAPPLLPPPAGRPEGPYRGVPRAAGGRRRRRARVPHRVNGRALHAGGCGTAGRGEGGRG
jgi:hypothetical protein